VSPGVIPHEAYRRLAARIITQAFEDAADPADRRPEALSARTFLSGSRMLRLWCAVADMNEQAVLARASEHVRPGAPWRKTRVECK